MVMGSDSFQPVSSPSLEKSNMDLPFWFATWPPSCPAACAASITVKSTVRHSPISAGQKKTPSQGQGFFFD